MVFYSVLIRHEKRFIWFLVRTCLRACARRAACMRACLQNAWKTLGTRLGRAEVLPKSRAAEESHIWFVWKASPKIHVACQTNQSSIKTTEIRPGFRQRKNGQQRILRVYKDFSVQHLQKNNFGSCFRLKTHTFRCVFAYRPHYNDRKRWSFSLKTHTFENAVQCGDIWKRSPIVLVWTAKTEAFENADVIDIAGASISVVCADDCCSVLSVLVWTGKTLRRR